jgi:hypothetical protein
LKAIANAYSAAPPPARHLAGCEAERLEQVKKARHQGGLRKLFYRKRTLPAFYKPLLRFSLLFLRDRLQCAANTKGGA